MNSTFIYAMSKIVYLLAFIGLTLSGCSPKENDNEMTKTLDSSWQFRQADQPEWMTAEAPGSVHTDLLKNGVIEHPYYRLNEHDVQWVDKMDWEYKTTFAAGADLLEHEHVELVFEGLDTYADVYLNGTQILSANNMFREWKANARDLLREGENELKIYFHSPTRIGLQKYDSLDYKIPVSQNDQSELGGLGNKRVSVHLRKAGYHFGWDWGPRLVTSGIWKPVYLHAWNAAAIRNVHIRQEKLTSETARLKAIVEAEASADGEAILDILVEGKTHASQPIDLKHGVHQYEVALTIEQPELWHPNGAGKQRLYAVEARLKDNKKTLSSKSTRIGLRTVEIVREKDDAGQSFYFKVNGRPLFMKGANYIPQDIFLNQVSPERYRRIISSAAKANLNMIRIWGGGVYEKDIFYDLCDEYGILVWQDFMFACAMFPGDSAFLENVRLEAADQIKRLRNHPSIAMWCGNNECLVAWHNWGWKQNAIRDQGQAAADRIWKSYEDIFHKTLPEAVSEHDPDRFYWASSPQAEQGVPENYVSGDVHYWGVWWGQEDFDNYRTKIPRFMSEFGFQSFPSLKTVKKYANESDWDIFSEVMKSHQRSNIGNGTIENYMLRHYQKPKDFPMFLYVGQILQAEGTKVAMEAHRVNMPYCMGSLFWQLDDCWPVASWSSIDYYGEWKAAQYFAAKAYHNILISPLNTGDSLQVYGVSDLAEDMPAILELTLMDFNGVNKWNYQSEITLKGNSSELYFTSAIEKIPVDDTTRLLLRAEIKGKNDETLSENILYFSNPKNLDLPQPNIRIAVENGAGGTRIRLSSDKLAKNVFLSTDCEGGFSDNYFDLLPGMEKEVVFDGAIGGDCGKAIKAVSLVDSYSQADHKGM